VMCIVH